MLKITKICRSYVTALRLSVLQLSKLSVPYIETFSSSAELRSVTLLGLISWDTIELAPDQLLKSAAMMTGQTVDMLNSSFVSTYTDVYNRLPVLILRELCTMIERHLW